MKKMFAGFLDYTPEEFSELWQEAIFIVDTNILLNFYKYTSKDSTKNFFDILIKLKDANRLWVPHQVALEYFFNYEQSMDKQKEGYKTLGEELKNLKKEAEKTFSKVKSSYPYIHTERFNFFIEDMKNINTKLKSKLDEEITTLPNTDVIKEDIFELISSIVGEPYTQEKIDSIETSGKQRYEYGIPPGYKDKDDKNKKGYRHYGNFKYQQLFGDLIVWNQIIDKAVELGKPVIFITEEKKEDWWEKEGSKIKRPHPNLIQEFLNKTGNNFYMYRTEKFVEFANEHLGAELTAEQVKEVAMEVENIRKYEDQSSLEKNQEITIDDYVNSNIEIINKLKKVDVETLKEYLSQEQKEVLIEKIRQAFNIKISSKESNNRYNNAVGWALKMSVPQLEERAQEVTAELSLKDYEKAQTLLTELDELVFTDNPVEKGIILFEYIKLVKSELFLLSLPF